MQIAEHSAYLEEVAVAASPKRLPALLRVLEAQQHQLVSPSERHKLHPFVVPLCNLADGSGIVGILRWPDPNNHKNMTLPVVRTTRGGHTVTILSRSVDEHLHRLLAQEDVSAGSSGERPLAAAAGGECEELYSRGQAASSGLGSRIELYLIKRAGLYPDVCEGLALGHLQRGDTTSALVAAEWYARVDHFPGDARPHEFGWGVLAGLGRHEEARDTARVALRMPWWTLQHGYLKTVTTAKLKGGPLEVKALLNEEGAVAATQLALKQSFREPKTARQVALDAAATLMDLVAAGEQASYDDVSAELADKYSEAGLLDVANFIRAA